MNGTFGVTYEQLQPKLSLSAGPSASKHGPNRPYEIKETCGTVAYQLKLPSHMSAVHDVFHVSQLRKCVRFPTEVLPEPELEIEPDLSYQEHPVRILDQKERSTRSRSIRMYKVQWSHHSVEEATWETEDFLCSRFPDFLPKGVGT
jgi:hypothetical protein